jgi:ATP-dependent Clp protease ATP-binding subunit ClpC
MFAWLRCQIRTFRQTCSMTRQLPWRHIARFTDRAREVLRLADEEAMRWHHACISTEHLLLALVAEGSGVAANVLRNLGVDRGQLAGEVQRLNYAGRADVAEPRMLTPRAKRAIACAVDEARALQHKYLGTEHLLLGLLREQRGTAAQVLLKQGLTVERVRLEIMKLLNPGQAKVGSA